MILRLKALSLMLVAVALILGTAFGQSNKNTTTIESRFPGLSSGPLSKATVASLKGGAILVADGISITAKDISNEIAKAPKETQSQLSKYPFFMLEQIAIRRLITNEAKKWASSKGITSNSDSDLIEKYINSYLGDIKVSDDEAINFFNENRSFFGDSTFEQAKTSIKSYLENEKRAKAVNDFINSISERHKIQISILWAGQQYQNWIKNPVEKVRRSGKPSMVNFGSENCRPCEMMKPIIAGLQKEYQGKVNIVFVHVGKEQVLGAVYGISAIPVQVFYDKTGKERFRHVGYFDKGSIIKKFKELGFI